MTPSGLIDTGPIWREGRGGKAVLLFHGLAGTPFELFGLTDHLARKGLSVYAPVLSHHLSRSLQDLAGSSLPGWKHDAEEAYARIRGSEKVIVGGISNGASLASYLALKLKVHGLIAICPPIFPAGALFGLRNQEIILRWLSRRFAYLPRFDFRMVRDWTLARELPRFRKLPSHFPYHAVLLAREIRENLARIGCPLLVIQARYDNRVNPKGARYFYENAGSSVKRFFWAARSGHVVVLDRDREAVFEEIARFTENV